MQIGKNRTLHVASLVSMPSVVKSMFDQVEQLVCLLLTNPASSAEAERSFSSLLSAQIENLCAKLYDPGAS